MFTCGLNCSFRRAISSYCCLSTSRLASSLVLRATLSMKRLATFRSRSFTLSSSSPTLDCNSSVALTSLPFGGMTASSDCTWEQIRHHWSHYINMLRHLMQKWTLTWQLFQNYKLACGLVLIPFHTCTKLLIMCKVTNLSRLLASCHLYYICYYVLPIAKQKYITAGRQAWASEWSKG